MKKLSLAFLTALSLAVTACGGGGGESSEPEAPTSPPGTSVQPTAPAPTLVGPKWNQINAANGGRRWQCYNADTGKAIKNELCAGIPQYDYYPG